MRQAKPGKEVIVPNPFDCGLVVQVLSVLAADVVLEADGVFVGPPRGPDAVFSTLVRILAPKLIAFDAITSADVFRTRSFLRTYPVERAAGVAPVADVLWVFTDTAGERGALRAGAVAALPVFTFGPAGDGLRDGLEVVATVSRVLREPALHRRCAVGRVVVDDHVDVEILERVAADLVEELAELDGAVPEALRDDVPVATSRAAKSVVVPLRLYSGVCRSTCPRRSGSIGWVRFSAWICDFSSVQSTSALSGGFM